MNAAISEPSGAALDAVQRDLDAVDAVLGLDADLLDRLVPAVVTSLPIEVDGAPIQLGYQSVRPWRAVM